MHRLRLIFALCGFVALAGCAGLFGKNNDECQAVWVAAFQPPVVSALDYGWIPGSKNQVIVEAAFQHRLSLPGLNAQPVLTHGPFTSPTAATDSLLEKLDEGALRVHFDVDSTRLSADDERTLDRLIAVIPPTDSVLIRVFGHTDATGRDAYNLRLSLRRAHAVKQYLLARGIEPTRVLTTGFGERAPIASNSTPGGRAQNRRADFSTWPTQ